MFTLVGTHGRVFLLMLLPLPVPIISGEPCVPTIITGISLYDRFNSEKID